MNDRFRFPAERPCDAPSMLWQLQGRLMADVEARLGPRAGAQQIYQPSFHDSAPCLINTPDMTGCFACLSGAAANYWPTAVFELAHETVHLLDPRVGGTNNLEEGVAVAYSLEQWRAHSSDPPPYLPSSYLDAVISLSALGSDYYAISARIRRTAGALGDATAEHIRAAAPAVPPDLASWLASPFRLT
jgi:hypothetical protein